jgi:hypothetical protein
MRNKWTLWGVVCLGLALVIAIASAALWAVGVWGSGIEGCGWWT